MFVFCNFAIFTIQGNGDKRKHIFEKYKKHVENVYTKTMKKVLKYIFPPEFFVKPAYFRSFTLALLYLSLIISQLFTFERFSGVVSGFIPIGSMAVISVVAFSLPLIESLSLPYLISMSLPEKYWKLSRWLAVITPAMWLVIALWQNLLPGVDKVNTGLFGATIPTAVGLWFVLFCALWLWAVCLVKNELPRR